MCVCNMLRKYWEGNGEGFTHFILYISILFQGVITCDYLVIKTEIKKKKSLYTY